MREKLIGLTVPLLAFSPLLAQAETDLKSIIGTGISILESLIPLLIGLALVYFIWGIVEFIGKSGDETARTEGKQKMIWGIIALFVIVAVWGLVGVIAQSFLDGDYGSSPGAPNF